ncbi:MAG: hypothetical protein ACJ763_11050 [Bdellovibrionia bacterium]
MSSRFIEVTLAHFFQRVWLDSDIIEVQILQPSDSKSMNLKRVLALTWVEFLAFALFAASSVACPLCHTETGQQVRAGILGSDFTSNLLVILAPFPVFALVVGWIYYGKDSKLK